MSDNDSRPESPEHVHMVSSEVNIFAVLPAPDCDEEGDREKNIVTRFCYKVPKHLSKSGRGPLDLTPAVDEDGDLDVVRSQSPSEERTLYIEHSTLTSLHLVGQQVWRGAFFLADYLLHNAEKYADDTVVELGSGVGLTSVAAAMVAKRVIATDVDRGEILKMIRTNAETNKDQTAGELTVHELDFFNKEWKNTLADLLPEVSLIIAADLVYHNTLTDAFVDTLKDLLTSGKEKEALIALEKRYVFTLEDLDAVAPCYEYFRRSLDGLVDTPTDGWTLKLEEITEKFPQYFCYERVQELVILRITARRN